MGLKPLLCVTATPDFVNSSTAAGGSCCGMQKGITATLLYIWGLVYETTG